MCNGEVKVHFSDIYITILVKHELSHDPYTNGLPDDLKLEIQDLSHRLPPALIFKELKSREEQDRIINLTLSQVAHLNNFR